jgi:hypothetical protein
MPSEGIFSGYCYHTDYSVATAIKGNIQWLLPSDGMFSGYCYHTEYSVATAIRRRGVTLTPHPLLVPRSENRVELYLYSR